MDYILKGVDPELWYRIKVMVAIRETTIKDVMIGLLEREVKEFETEVVAEEPKEVV